METLSNLYNKLKEDSNKELVKTLGIIYFIFIVLVFIFMIFIRGSRTGSPVQTSNNHHITRSKPFIKREPERRYFVRTRPQFEERIEKNIPSRFLISDIIN